jgi:hypothetical protein
LIDWAHGGRADDRLEGSMGDQEVHDGEALGATWLLFGRGDVTPGPSRGLWPFH